MRIVVLTKPVPDPAAGAERLGPDLRLDRAASPTVVNGNDEYALEAALQLVEAHGGEVVMLTMAPANGTETIRKALAMGAHRGILVTDEALAGADVPTTIRVLAAAVGARALRPAARGLDTSDGAGGAVAAGVAARLGLPLLSAAGGDRAGPGCRARPRAPPQPPRATTWSRRRCRPSSPARRRWALRATRRSRGSWRARSREIAPAVAGGPGRGPGAGRRCLDEPVVAADPPAGPRRGTRDRRRRPQTWPARSPTSSRPEAHLMPAAILAVAEVADGALDQALHRGRDAGTRRSRRPPAGPRSGSSSTLRRTLPRAELAAFLPARDRRRPARRSPARGRGAARRGRDRPTRRRGRDPRASSAPRPDGRDIAGMLVGLTGWGCSPTRTRRPGTGEGPSSRRASSAARRSRAARSTGGSGSDHVCARAP